LNLDAGPGIRQTRVASPVAGARHTPGPRVAGAQRGGLDRLRVPRL